MSHFSVVNSVLPLWRKQLPSRFIGIGKKKVKKTFYWHITQCLEVFQKNLIFVTLRAKRATFVFSLPVWPFLARKFKYLKKSYYCSENQNETFFMKFHPLCTNFGTVEKYVLKAFPWSIHPRISFSHHIFGFYSSSLSSSSNLKS